MWSLPLRAPICDSDTHSEGGGGLQALPRLTAASFTDDYRECVLDWSRGWGRAKAETDLYLLGAELAQELDSHSASGEEAEKNSFSFIRKRHHL